jgi:hypothetical protein
MKQAENKNQESMTLSKARSRKILGVVSVFFFIMGVILVAYSGYSLGQGSGTLVTGFGIFLGLAIAILSFLAVYGVCAQSDRALIAFFCVMLILSLFMTFVMICAFIFTGEVEMYVNGNWQQVQGSFVGQSQQQIVATIKTNLLAVAVISLFALVFMFTSLIYSARVLGAAKTQSKIMHLVNLLTLILGVFIIVTAAITAFVNFNQRVIAYVLLGVGSGIFAVSFFGYYGTKWRSPVMLFTYFTFVTILTIMLLGLGIACYVNKPAAIDFVAKNWASTASSLSIYIGKVSSYLTILGSVAIGGVVFMSFAMVVSFLLAQNIRHGDVDATTPGVPLATTPGNSVNTPTHHN